jgi:hypothetical protein
MFIRSLVQTKGALQVTALPQSTVYLNGEILGKTPLCRCDPNDQLPTGEYTIQIVPEDNVFAPYEDTIVINGSVLTVVDWLFGDIGKSQGSSMTLVPIGDSSRAEMYITSLPLEATVVLDGAAIGMTPVVQSDLTESDHELILNKPGYQQKILRVRAIKGYRLHVAAMMATGISQPSASIASQSANINRTSETAATSSATIRIQSTPTGFLRVREKPAVSAKEVAQVMPGQVYPMLSEQDGWFQIDLKNGIIGWVSSQYARKE